MLRFSNSQMLLAALVFLAADLPAPEAGAQARPSRPALIRDTDTAEGKNEAEAAKEKPFNPLEAERHFRVGEFYAKRKNYAAAIQRYLDAIQYQPNLVKAHLALGHNCIVAKDAQHGVRVRCAVYGNAQVERFALGERFGRKERANSHFRLAFARVAHRSHRARVDLGAFGAKRFDLRFRLLKSRHQFFVVLGGLVELVAGLVQPTDFFFHRLNLYAELFDLPDLFFVPMNHVWVSLGQPLGDVLNGISEGPKPAWTSFRIGHGTTRDKREPCGIVKSKS